MMENTFGRQQVKTISGLTHNRKLATALQVLFLLGIGMLAILLHARLRSPINIPGHHGIEFMALLLVGRMSSPMKFAASISSLGIGLLLLFPVFGFHDPMMGINYMLPGILLDLMYQLGAKSRKKVLFLAAVSGIAYMMIPLSRLMISLSTGYQYGAFIKHGFVTPFLSYMFFGVLGGLFGSGLCAGFKKILNKISK